MGVVASWSSLVPDEMFLSAAGALAAETSATDLEQGRLYPSSDANQGGFSSDLDGRGRGRIRAQSGDDASTGRPPFHIRALIYEPRYPDYART